MKDKLNVFWFRRDLRLEDNAGLYHALSAGKSVLPVFIFDTDILSKLEDRSDRRVNFIYLALEEINLELRQFGSSLLTLSGNPLDAWRTLLSKYDISDVFVNCDYEPYAIKRDNEIKDYLCAIGINFHAFKDQVIFEKDEVVKSDGKPYTIFTPYSRTWLANLSRSDVKSCSIRNLSNNFYMHSSKVLSLQEIGFNSVPVDFPSGELRKNIIKNYEKTRDIPSIEGTSRLSVHLRFGTVSIRKLVKEALKLSDAWLRELIWREFFMMILYHFPHSAANSFRPEYDRIKWRNNEAEFDAWCKGKTGFPIVDAGMRELNSTGFMHNRPRMITASFLVKDLLVDWRWGERYFAEKLLDYELSSNAGNWQWAAGSGCDSVPYFRIFSPELQQKKFDPEFKYIRKWVPEYESTSYPRPIVEHKTARENTIAAYKEAISNSR